MWSRGTDDTSRGGITGDVSVEEGAGSELRRRERDEIEHFYYQYNLKHEVLSIN